MISNLLMIEQKSVENSFWYQNDISKINNWLDSSLTASAQK